MANAIFMFILLVVIGEAFVIWLMNDELKLRRHESDSFRSQLTFDSAVRVSRQLAAAQPHTMTAKDIAAGNLTRQARREEKKRPTPRAAGRSWSHLKADLEQRLEHDPENERAKRIEKFQGEN